MGLFDSIRNAISSARRKSDEDAAYERIIKSRETTAHRQAYAKAYDKEIRKRAAALAKEKVNPSRSRNMASQYGGQISGMGMMNRSPLSNAGGVPVARSSRPAGGIDMGGEPSGIAQFKKLSSGNDPSGLFR